MEVVGTKTEETILARIEKTIVKIDNNYYGIIPIVGKNESGETCVMTRMRRIQPHEYGKINESYHCNIAIN